MALSRIEQLLAIINEEVTVNEKLPYNEVDLNELIWASDIVEAYEKEHFPIGVE